jgi:hypothetical protein
MPIGTPVPRLSRIAIESISNVRALVTLTSGRERTPQEKQYDKMVASCVRKSGKHRQKRFPKSLEHRFPGIRRLYTVTTMASSLKYGGTRTPVICDSFKKACRIIEKNAGDVFETTYRLAVVEAVFPNHLYGGLLDERYWWRWEGSYKEGGYVPIETPKAYENIIGFGIG